MIQLIDINNSDPYNIFIKYYDDAIHNKQFLPEAISISSFNSSNNEVDSRYVNLKYVIDDEWIFFSNYHSNKSKDFSSHNQISILIYWASINVQIRMKAKIRKTADDFSDEHFSRRSKQKNALAISSNQSKIIDSYQSVINNFEEAINDESLLSKRPPYWGGYSFTPYYFEFWEGHESRLNKRRAFSLDGDSWQTFILQP
jgi:pyridoxamine 5'-phosphate oxidase|tara:strand:- start:483 stop:1082 length:600 start_codon:yes stop_codon:yes gene_type:complete